MPSEEFGGGVVVWVGGKENGFAVAWLKELRGVAEFVEVGGFDEHVVVVVEGPEPAVEEPVGGFGEGEAVGDGVRPSSDGGACRASGSSC